MDTSGWTTQCFGRFLVDLPQTAKSNQTYKIRGNKIERVSGSPEILEQRIQALERQASSERRKDGSSLLVEKILHNNGSASIISWKSKESSILWRESYFVAPGGRVAYQNSGYVSPDRKLVAIENAKRIADNIRVRAPGDIPTIPGFCIDGGLIAGNDYRSESFTVDVSFPDHPNVQLEIFASTGAEENRLLERVGGFLRTEVLGTAAGLKTLRKRKRDVGPIDAEEYLVAASDKGQRVYSFAWESQGKDGSLSEPNLGVNLGVLEQSVVNEKEPYRPAFKSDEEALELWDVIIESIRLRPGAV